MSGSSPRILVLGLDSVPPSLLFDRFLPRMPNVRKLLARSAYGTLRSTDPPITVPAWAVLFSGMDPGSLGIYGFRHRRPGTYWENYVPTSRTVRHPQVWDYLSRQGKRACVIGMPPGYPPPSINGIYISDFLTPSKARDFVSPGSLTDEIDRVAGGYVFDVPFRADDRERIGNELMEMTRKHFRVARHLWDRERWDLFALHEIGPDRIHHTFWKFFDPTHPRYEENPRLRALVEDYYSLLDDEIGQLLQRVPADVRIWLVSDHGSQAMQGCFCINEWLMANGFLFLKGPRPAPGTPIEKVAVDWSRTQAWGSGGYYARIFYNVKGREPEGLVAPDQVAALESRLIQGLEAVLKPDGTPLGADVRPPRSLYREVWGDAPDLMAYFGDVAWRSAGTIGHPTLFLMENDTGPDDSVHSFDGVYAVTGTRDGAGIHGPQERILDVAPTLLETLGIPVPERMQGRSIRRLL
ncbi:type I phosphodiesterase/nucleotide pyrophosphatase [mine drainage metagenome]|uniref:Type I phosphodiesterase/nucleotide pyrophosphatase n=1 Tax=mine drainage metagenome TaxID=410659 RepID=T0YD79_9ZZZZ